MKSKNPGYEPGNHWVICDICGVAYRNKEMRETWDNKIVCRHDYEPRHPQEFVKAQKEKVRPEGHVRSDPEETYSSDTPSYDRSESHHTVPSGTF